ncbi:MFS transporter [Arachidicoccus terrestris]|uniref:MFS transporter n=1 Tax=Arachidicoccus terrestris TaxID=2875539 RepID=UPI001CC76055|nr:MFS transporter [Arachidicoccus terrestris]UAY55331.1 MFS transporter [Arachidicoccus terrestris]
MKRSYTIVSLIMLTFFVISFLTNIIGALNPDFIQDFDLSLTLAALLPFAFFIAYGLVSIPTGILLEKYREKKIMIFGFVTAFAGSLILAIWPNYLTAIISLFIIGSGMAMLQVVINPLLRTAGGEKNYAFTSVLAQLIFGAASFLSPRAFTYVVQRLSSDADSKYTGLVPSGMPWIALYWIFALISLAMIIIIALMKFPKVELNEDEKAGSLKVHLALLRKPVVILYFLGIFFYVGTEQGLNNNISLLLQTLHGVDPATAADTLGNFWGYMTVGNILGLLLLKIMDSRLLLRIFTILAMISLAVGLFGSGGTVLYAFPMVGFFISVMYPIIFSLALNSMSEHHGSFAGILVTAIIGGAVIPLIMGAISDQFGLTGGMIVLFLTMGYILSIGFWAKPLINNATIGSKKKNNDG